MDEKEVKVDEVSVSDDAVEKQQDTAASSDIAPDSDQSVNDTDTEIEKLNNQIAELTDKFLRLAAELENTRRRAALDIESSARNRAMSVAKKFLPVMDAIEAAQQHAPNDEGIKSMAKAMNDAFAQIGITKIESYVWRYRHANSYGCGQQIKKRQMAFFISHCPSFADKLSAKVIATYRHQNNSY